MTTADDCIAALDLIADDARGRVASGLPRPEAFRAAARAFLAAFPEDAARVAAVEFGEADREAPAERVPYPLVRPASGRCDEPFESSVPF